MVASFRARVPAASGRRPFRFTMINVHTDPDVVDPKRTDSEINVLADVFHRVREYEFGLHGEDDFILLGDLNVDTERLGALGQIPGVISVAGDVMTNVTRSQTYDHILIDRNITREYAERMGVIDFQQDLGLNEDQAKAISDHLPLWAEFSVYEAPPPMQQPAAETASRTRLIE
jgi:endonuclease/exonuclease/phosphatase family metal-dependent hydrolase